MLLDILIAAVAMVGADASLSAVKESGCSAMVETLQGTVEPVDDASLKVLLQTATSSSFTYGREKTRAIRCLRSDIVPAANDYKVLGAGYPLYIVDASTPETRIGVLEVSGGQFRFRTIQGELLSDEKQRLLLRLNEFQEAARTAR